MNTTDKTLFFDAAWNIGCELMKTAICHDGACNWQGYSVEWLNGSYQPVMRTFGPDLYSGTSGIALFLAALYEEKADPLLLDTIAGSVAQMRSAMSGAPAHGFYAGTPGIAAALIRLGQQLQRDDWMTEGLQKLEATPCKTLAAHEIDVISGAAGTIPVLLQAAARFSRPELLRKAIALGHVLCDAAVKENGAWSWPTVPAPRNLTGYSHGASGVALALLELHHAAGIPLFLEAAKGGFRYERNAFDSLQQNWPDYREGVTTPSATVCSMAWCHGAPGIALSRLAALEQYADPELDSELAAASATTAASIWHSLAGKANDFNYSLCHGIAGNADILLETGQDAHRRLAHAVGISGIRAYQERGQPWPSGLNTGHPAPGLMMGLAGTGYFYLRLLDPNRHRTLLRPSL
jgi:lantibiotic biosynthesis protein